MNFLPLTLASIGAGFVAVDRDGRVTHMNAVAAQMTGWDAVEARGRILWEVFVRADRTAADLSSNPVDVMLGERVSSGAGLHVELLSRSGSRTHVEVKSDFTRGEDGLMEGAALIFRDMSPLMRAEAEARRLAAIVESSNDAIIGKDLAGNITSWNRAAEAMFGYSASEVIGRSVLMLVPASRVAAERGMVDTLAAGSRIPTFDTVGLAKDGGERQLSVTISPILDARGVVVGASRSARDVSQERRAEAALRESESKLRFTMEAARIGEWDLDLATGRAQQSALHARCFGYQQVQQDWSLDRFLAHVHPEDRPQVERLCAEAKTTGRLRFECRVVWPDASVHWIAVHGSAPFAGGVQRPVRMLGIVTDITEQKMAEDARLTALRLAAENREIQESNRLKNLFLANMSHELRTPLNAIIGFSDLLKSGAVAVDSPKHGEFIGHIASSGRLLLQIINDILDLSKIESGNFQFAPQPANLRVLVREVMEVFHSAIQGKSVELLQEFDDSLDETLWVDPVRLKQALCNYVSNAIKFTPSGGHVVIRTVRAGTTHIRIEVEDDGIGIMASDIPKLFREFQQLDAGMTKQHQGTGLGLALTRRLIEAQGGRVGVRSIAGCGSVFHLELARIPIEEAPGPTGRDAALGVVT